MQELCFDAVEAELRSAIGARRKALLNGVNVNSYGMQISLTYLGRHGRRWPTVDRPDLPCGIVVFECRRRAVDGALFTRRCTSLDAILADGGLTVCVFAEYTTYMHDQGFVKRGHTGERLVVIRADI